MKLVRIDTNKISDWKSFHQVFKETLGFPDYYGANGNAWIDCMTYVDDPDLGMTQITVEKGGILILEVPESEKFKEVCPKQSEDLIANTAFVNWRRIEAGDKPVLALLLC
ncbi:MAG: barstar family protein [Leptolyngbya sp. BL-A-14]